MSQRSQEQRVVEQLIEKVGPEALVGLSFYASLDIIKRRVLYVIESYDADQREFHLLDAQTKEPVNRGVSAKRLEIGLESRDLEDPLIDLLGRNQLPVLPFCVKYRTPQRESDKRSMEVSKRTGQREEASGIEGHGRIPARKEKEIGEKDARRPRKRKPRSPSPITDAEQSDSSDESPREPKKGLKRKRDWDSPKSSDSDSDAGRGKKYMTKDQARQLENLVRQSKLTGEQAELRRMQADIPSERRGLRAQFEMLAVMHASPESWGPLLALSGCMGTSLKALDMGCTYLAEAHFNYVRQLCEDAGADLTEGRKKKIDAKAWALFRKQRAEAEKQIAKTGGLAKSRYASSFFVCGSNLQALEEHEHGDFMLRFPLPAIHTNASLHRIPTEESERRTREIELVTLGPGPR